MGYETRSWKTEDVDKHGPPALPLDVYQCEFTKAEAAESKSSGNPMIQVTIGALNNFDGEPVKASFKDFLTFTDGAIFKVVQALEAADLGVDELKTDLQFREELAEALVGCKFWATLGPQPSAKGDGREFTGVITYLTEKEVEEAVAKIRTGDTGKQNGASKSGSGIVRRRG